MSKNLTKELGRIEKRVVGFVPDEELRAQAQPDRISGYAVVWGARSLDLGWFTESIRQGAFTRSLETKPDVKGLKNHNPDLIFARTRAGNLTLKEDSKGLRIEASPLPDTQMARDLAKDIAFGLLDQMSFAFRVVEQQWSINTDGEEHREIIEADLMDISVVTYPAYPATVVEARSLGIPNADVYYRDLEEIYNGRPPHKAGEKVTVRTRAGYWAFKQRLLELESY